MRGNTLIGFKALEDSIIMEITTRPIMVITSKGHNKGSPEKWRFRSIRIQMVSHN